MIGNLEKKFGNVNTWTQETLQEMMDEGKEVMKEFDKKTIQEIISRGNQEINIYLEEVLNEILVTESSKRFTEILTENIDENMFIKDSGFEEILKYLKSESVFDRINSYLILLSNSDKDGDKNYYNLIDKEQLKKDLAEISAIYASSNTNNSNIDRIVPYFIYRIQEFYFEIFGENIFEETEEFKEKNKRLEEFILNDIRGNNEEE